MKRKNIIHNQATLTYRLRGESEEMKMKREVIAIEKHLYENKNHTVRTEYQVYYEPRIYNIKTPSQLTKREKVAFKEIGKTIFHF